MAGPFSRQYYINLSNRDKSRLIDPSKLAGKRNMGAGFYFINFKSYN